MSKSAECETEPARAADGTPPNKLGRTNDPPQNHPPTNDPPLKDLQPENPPSFVVQIHGVRLNSVIELTEKFKFDNVRLLKPSKKNPTDRV